MQVKACKGNGITSNKFKINVNGISTTWKLSLQFWVDGQGSRLANPAVLCLNLVGCRAGTRRDLAVKYKFGIYNQNSQEMEMGAANKVREVFCSSWTSSCCRPASWWRRWTSCSL